RAHARARRTVRDPRRAETGPLIASLMKDSRRDRSLDVEIAQIDGNEQQVADGFRSRAARERSAFGRKPKSVGLDDVVHVLLDRNPAADLKPIVMTPQEMVRPEIELLVGAVARRALRKTAAKAEPNL